MVHTNFKLLFIVLISMLIISCSGDRNPRGENGSVVPNSAFDELLDGYFKEGLQLYPLTATDFGIDGYNHLFPNTLSDSYRAKQIDYYQRYAEKTGSFSDAELSPGQQVSKSIIALDCAINLERLSFRQDLMPVDQTWSVNHLIGQWATGTGAQPFNTVQDYRDWLERLNGYLEWMASAEVKMKEGMELGYVLPSSLILKIPGTLEPFRNDDPALNPFFRPVSRFPDSFTEQEKEELTDAYEEMITTRIIPAYQRLYEFISTEYLASGRETSGIDGIPDGKAFYKLMIRSETSTELTANEIFQLGLNEVSRISREMEKVKAEVGYEGDLSSFFQFVRDNEALKPYASPEEVIGHFKAIYTSIQPRVDRLFNVKPEIGFEIRRTEPFLEKTTGPHYKPGSLDGTRPGVFYVSIPDAENYNTMFDESLFLHEAIPGHHFQIALTQENGSLPDFRRYLWLNAYGEGWALYTESLGKELGLYTDPYQYFGNLSEEMHRAVRLVVDAGLHAKGWTREEAIRYSLEHEPYDEQTIISEIERYMAFPGQALGYKIGQLKILELRDRAERELGDKFNIQEFHNMVLGTGCIPLGILEEIIDQWISDQR